MYLLDGSVVTSASDMKKACDCEFAFLRELDVKLGRETLFAVSDDAMLIRAGQVGDAHELRLLERYRSEFGSSGVVEIERPDVRDVISLKAATEATATAFSSGAAVVFQATFHSQESATQGFIGFADFIVRQPDGSYRIQDAKLARSAKVTALLQLAAYADHLAETGIVVDKTVELLLGNGTVSAHQLDDIMPVYLSRLARLRQLVDERIQAGGPIEWGDTNYHHDGRCPTCELEVNAHRDVLLVGGLRTTQREILVASGVNTIDQLAARKAPVEQLSDATLSALRAQARLQLIAEDAERTAIASGKWQTADPPLPPPVELREPGAIGAIPLPSPGDLFFDFEGDPLYTEGDATKWNLDYLWGMVDTADTYTKFWAHSFSEERIALIQFLELIKLRRTTYPDMHIYHYASYERTHLAAIAARHGVGEAEVDQLLADGVLVDLYPIVKRAVRVGSRSYSIKKLEPLYMGSQLRQADVKSGADSIIEYVRARELALSNAPDVVAESTRILNDLADYNRYDCVSTHRLRDWLIQIARNTGVTPAAATSLVDRLNEKIYEASPIAAYLRSLIEPDPSVNASSIAGHQTVLAGIARTRPATAPVTTPEAARHAADRVAISLAAAAVDFHRREAKNYWWAHFLRCDQPVEAWENNRDVMVIDLTATQIVEDWHLEPRRQNPRRKLLLSGQIAPGSRFSVGSEIYLLYDWPSAVPAITPRPGQRATARANIIELTDAGLLVEEHGAANQEWSDLPMAIAPGPPPRTESLDAAINEWAGLITTPESLPLNPAMDLLRRLPPRTTGGLVPKTPEHDYVAAVTDSIQRLDNSYLAVQGPPGTGKTYVASHVITRLVTEHGWRVGVVAQSHAVVEHVLDAVVNAGLDPSKVAKSVKETEASRSFTALPTKDSLATFTESRGADGYVIGGTAWDFCNTRRVARNQLDLLVIDEAGQFSLASTIAVAVAARNLLLLGDPQQLPQVSQAVHPEPVDTSALGWIAAGHDVLPPEFGFFLAESRRMHPELAHPVSTLSYSGELRSHPVSTSRKLDLVPPGLQAVPVQHSGNATQSPEETATVVEIAQSLLDKSWLEPPAPDRQLEQTDLIVVTPYNAQLAMIREALDSVGLTEVPVGTVDKFQGQEAVVAIVSLAASSAETAPRGTEFLLLKNRLNVAISRAKWAAYLIYSPGLLEHLPRTPAGLAQLSAFMRLTGAANSSPTQEPRHIRAGIPQPSSA